ncbi:spe-49 [Pristionchus pacificus]|uniref:DC_STAMP domain-containing protein n=1 Tax=Pristionchus pacificus TaxID=54126 RepID=A0A2A6BRB9_PRIPA|nr:spe-49 [Pristionchus pacificus]|eukprot:PDM68460.1 hypothetical protein PRIPAC_43962 [Pristionchus pacificus]
MERLSLFFDDVDRASIRRRKRRSFFVDYLFRSEVTHYAHLRFLINFVLGLLISACLYYLGWKRFNFADFNYAFGLIVKWFIIFGLAFVFTYSPVFRCATICMIFGAIGKNGQLPLSMLVFNSLNDGPVSSIVQNFRLTTEAVLCNLQVQSEVTTSRISMLTGPLEDIVEAQILKGVKLGRKITRTLKAFIDPFRSDFTGEITEEDISIEHNERASKDAGIRLSYKKLHVLAQRDEMLRLESEGGSSGVEDEEAAMIGKMKNPAAKNVTARLAHRCDNVFAKGMEKCHEVMGGLKLKCIGVLRMFGLYICNKLDVLTICEDAEKKKESSKICAANLKKIDGSNTFEEQVLTDSSVLPPTYCVEMHVKAIKMPRVENTLLISDIKEKMKGNVAYTKESLHFSDAVKMITNYRSNVDFNNKFITARFWEIDHLRESEGKDCLHRISKLEWKEYGLLKVFGLPTKVEAKAARKPLLKWLATLFFVVIVVAVDRYIKYILSKVLPMTIEEITNKAVHKTTIRLVGKGALADLINDILTVNKTRGNDQEFSNEQCLFTPIETPLLYIGLWIAMPLFLMLVLQVIFAFVIKRLVLFYVLPFMFPKRDRVRMIFLYNKILFNRHKNRQRARARIRFVADRWKMNENVVDGGLFSHTSWLKTIVIDRMFKTGECIYCKETNRPSSLIRCPDCPATYCRACVDELDGDCYACLAQDGLVNSTRTHLIELPSIPDAAPKQSGSEVH